MPAIDPNPSARVDPNPTIGPNGSVGISGRGYSLTDSDLEAIEELVGGEGGCGRMPRLPSSADDDEDECVGEETISTALPLTLAFGFGTLLVVLVVSDILTSPATTTSSSPSFSSSTAQLFPSRTCSNSDFQFLVIEPPSDSLETEESSDSDVPRPGKSVETPAMMAVVQL